MSTEDDEKVLKIKFLGPNQWLVCAIKKALREQNVPFQMVTGGFLGLFPECPDVFVYAGGGTTTVVELEIKTLPEQRAKMITVVQHVPSHGRVRRIKTRNGKVEVPLTPGMLWETLDPLDFAYLMVHTDVNRLGEFVAQNLYNVD